MHIEGRTRMTRVDMLKEYWGLLAGLIAAVAWLVRLEAIALSNRREIRLLWSQRKEDLANAKSARDETNKMLEEIRTDIKAILGRK